MNIRRSVLRVLVPFKSYSKQCHVASMKLVRAGIGHRVARGFCNGVGGQHSWVVIGDCYNPEKIIDPTLWSYRDDVKSVYIGGPERYGHRPHGSGNIWNWGKPFSSGGTPVALKAKLSQPAKMFLEMLGPLDFSGWQQLSSAPVGGWPSKEIFTAMHNQDGLRALVPVDVLGMLTDINPGGLYI